MLDLLGWFNSFRAAPAKKPSLPAPMPSSAARAMKARYDAAQTNDDNRRLWADADGLSARAANSPNVRRILRNRVRYECTNNSYLVGIVQTLANHTIGTGPRLQLLTEDDGLNRAVERSFAEWADAVYLAEKLRTMRCSRVWDGEAFALLETNPMLGTPSQLDVRLVEADQIATPTISLLTPNAVDGIEFDRYGNPSQYHVLHDHPGDYYQVSFGEYDTIPAKYVLHWFRADRPGQARGIPEITSAIADFSELRRFSKAVLAAAETAADYAAILYTDAPAGGECANIPQDAGPMLLDIERRSLMTVPDGWKLDQLKAEQPTTTYAEFERQKVRQFVRCLNMPLNIALGDSSGYNYSSGRLDHQNYFKSVAIDQSHCVSRVLNRIFVEWLTEMTLRGAIPAKYNRDGGWPKQWFWDEYESIDPQKEAQAQQVRLANRTTTLAAEYAKQGKDWEVQLRQIAREQALMEELGITPQAAQQALAPPAEPDPADDPTGDSNADDTGDE